jgi:hypothetical protein
MIRVRRLLGRLQGGEYPGSVPPNYIKTYDEGRPRS